MNNLLTRYFRYLVFFTGFLIVILFAIIDRYLSHHPALIIFYVIPVYLVTWFSGTMAGIFISLCSVVAWLSHGIPSARDLYVYPIFFYVNMLLRGSFLFIVVYVLQRLKTALAREKESNERKSTFVANVAHEIRSPLTIIKEDFDILLDEKSSKIEHRQKMLLEMGQRNVNRLLRLVTDLLDISKIEAGKIKLKVEKVDLALLVIDIMKTHEGEILKKHIIVKKDIQQNIGPLYADKDKLTEVIINLLTNAIKYTSSGTIIIKLTGNHEQVRFEITDSGPGISKENIKKIFDKFERIITEKQEGTGLGLSIAKDIIELHKGNIWVESVVGKGSKFIFTLPRNLKNTDENGKQKWRWLWRS